MFIELGDYDPSNEYIVNYSDSKTIRLSRKLTEKRIDIETLCLQIYNQRTKNEKPKRTKHNDSTLDSRLTKINTKMHNKNTHNIHTQKFKVLKVKYKILSMIMQAKLLHLH